MIFAILLCSVSLCSALEIPDDYVDEITALDFYPGGAKFTFNIRYSDSDGIFHAILPGSFRADSIKVVNPEDVDGDIKVEVRSRTKWTPSQLEDIQSEVDEQTKITNDLTAKKLSLEQTLELLKNSKPDASNPNTLLRYMKNAQTLRLDTENQLASLKLELDRETEKLNMLNNELNSRRPYGENTYLVVSGKAKGIVTLEAFTNAAVWSPKYIMDLNSETGDIEVHMFVKASQRTGLDYDGDITLHTKTPDENITTPDLQPLKVGIKPREETIMSTSMVNITRTNRMYSRKAMPEAVDEDTAVGAVPAIPAPVVHETLSDRTINISGLITGDGQENEFEATTGAINLKSTPVIMLIPEQRSNAWIIASMDEGNERLIPGEAALRVDGHSSGKIFIQEFGEGQRRIPFGYAEQITVKKEALIEKTGVSWFSGVFTSGYKLEITNGTQDDKLITIRDRLPVPTDEKIKLDIKRIEPRQKTLDDEKRLTWELTIPAGGTVNIIVDYTLSYPSGEELQYGTN